MEKGEEEKLKKAICEMQPHTLPYTENPEKVCKSCEAGPRQGQAEKWSKSRKKFLSTTYKPFPGGLCMLKHVFRKLTYSALQRKSKDEILL